MYTLIIYLFFFLMPFEALAQKAEKIKSIGQVAGELIEPVTVLSHFVASGSLIVGVAAFAGALMRYMQYRANPLATPISTVIFLFILSLVLIGLPFIYLLLGAGVPFSISGLFE